MPLLSRFFCLPQQQMLVAHVQTAGGLVQQQQTRLLHQRPGDGHLLPLAAGQLRDAALHQRGKGHVGQHLRGGGAVGWAGLQAEAGQAAQQHGVEHRQIAEPDVLRHIGDAPCPLPPGQGRQLLPIEADGAAVRGADAQQIPEQRGLAGAVAAQQDADLAVPQRQRRVPQHRRAAAAVRKGQMLHGQHAVISFRAKRMVRKNGAPSREVMAPTGSAEPLPRLRDSTSASSSRRLPLRAEAGIDQR